MNGNTKVHRHLGILAVTAGIIFTSGLVDVAQAQPSAQERVDPARGGHSRDARHDGKPDAKPDSRHDRPRVEAPIRINPPTPPVVERPHHRYEPPRRHYEPPHRRTHSDYHHGGHHFRWVDGRWHRYWNGSFRVGLPPIGFWIPHLPPYYSLWHNGPNSYFVVDGTYFRALPNEGGYVVISAPTPVAVQPLPPPAPVIAPAPAVPAYTQFINDIYAYPKGTQTEARLFTDKQECAQWSGGQVLGDVYAAPVYDSQKDNYRRAFSACMEARNYTVR